MTCEAIDYGICNFSQDRFNFRLVVFERVFKKRDGLISATILIITRVIFTW
jgi:hypothetical protein